MRIARVECPSAIVLLLDRQEEELCVPTNNVGSWQLNVAGRFTWLQNAATGSGAPLAGDARLLEQRLERAVNTLPDPIRRASSNEPRSPVD